MAPTISADMNATDAIQIVQPATLDQVVMSMLDSQIGTTQLLAEELDGTGSLGQPFVDAMNRLLAHLVNGDAASRDAVARTLPPVYSSFLDILSVRRQDHAATVRMARCWLAHLVTDRMASGNLSPLASVVGSRLLQRFPKLQDHLNDDGLIRLTPELKFDRHGVVFDGHLIRYHPFIGVSRASSPEYDLLAMLCDHAARTSNDVSIAIDGSRIIPAEKAQMYLLEDHWRGRPFMRGDLDDPHALGVTIHTAPDISTAKDIAAACMLAGIQRTEFIWKHKESVKTFEAEEVMVAERDRRGRYLHAEYKLANKPEHNHFRHLDGAVMVYSPADEQTRRQASCVLPKTPRAACKPKLFRIDGNMTVEHWTTALCLFFRGNPLVLEYLAGETGPSVDTITTAP